MIQAFHGRRGRQKVPVDVGQGISPKILVGNKLFAGVEPGPVIKHERLLWPGYEFLAVTFLLGG
jgi:hypothetical protein